MKRSLVVIHFLAVFLFFLANCEVQAAHSEKTTPLADEPQMQSETAAFDEKPGKAEKGDSPSIKFEKVVEDFGEIGPGAKKTCEFQFKNVGTGILEINDITKTCGCTPHELEKTEYLPGESGVLKVTYNAATRPGDYVRRIYVSSNDPENPKVELKIQSTIIEKVEYTPERLVLSLEEENAGAPTIVVKSVDGKEFSITRISSTAGAISADFDPEQKATEFEIQPKVNMDRLRRGINGTMNIDLTHPDAKRVSIPFRSIARFEVNPPTIIIFNAEPEKTISREIWVLSNYGSDYEIESVDSDKGIIVVDTSEKLDDRYQMQVDITPPAKDGDTRLFTDTLRVKIKGGEEIEIQCRGFYSKN